MLCWFVNYICPPACRENGWHFRILHLDQRAKRPHWIIDHNNSYAIQIIYPIFSLLKHMVLAAYKEPKHPAKQKQQQQLTKFPNCSYSYFSQSIMGVLWLCNNNGSFLSKIGKMYNSNSRMSSWSCIIDCCKVWLSIIMLCFIWCLHYEAKVQKGNCLSFTSPLFHFP